MKQQIDIDTKQPLTIEIRKLGFETVVVTINSHYVYVGNDLKLTPIINYGDLRGLVLDLNPTEEKDIADMFSISEVINEATN